MGIQRVRLEFERDFTRIPNEWVRDKRLSRRARGLLAELMSHHIGWRVSVASLVKSGPEGKDAIHTAIKELEAQKYLRRVQSRNWGKFGEVEYALTAPLATVGGKPANGGKAVGGLSDDGESAPKKTSSSEDQDVEPPLFCNRHPFGGVQCPACGDARRVHSKWTRTHRHLEVVTPTVSGIYTPPTCEHGYPIGECAYCVSEGQPEAGVADAV